MDIVKWGIIYQTIRKHSIDGVNNSYLEYLRASFGTYANLLMDIVDKCSTICNGTLVIEEPNRLNNALKQVITYDAARFLGGYPAKEITRFIPSIPSKLKSQNPEYYEEYAKSFESLVTNTNEGYQQPSLSVLQRAVHSLDLYSRKGKPLKRFLILLENIGKNELLSFESDLKECQIEHIMPQTFKDKWNHISSDEHEKFLHTLGNLSLTLNNQNLSNKEFEEKKVILANKSRITLNQHLLNYSIFSVESIKDRATKMLALFTKEFNIKKIEKSIEIDPSEQYVIMRHGNILAKGKYTDKKLTVLKESGATINDQSSLSASEKKLKKELIDKGVLVKKNDTYVFTENTLFSSPSQAAAIIAGSSINGRTSWKTEENITLKDLGL